MPSTSLRAILALVLLTATLCLAAKCPGRTKSKVPDGACSEGCPEGELCGFLKVSKCEKKNTACWQCLPSPVLEKEACRERAPLQKGPKKACNCRSKEVCRVNLTDCSTDTAAEALQCWSCVSNKDKPQVSVDPSDGRPDATKPSVSRSPNDRPDATKPPGSRSSNDRPNREP